MKFKRILTCTVATTLLLSNLIPVQGIAAQNKNDTIIETQVKSIKDDEKSGMYHGVREPSEQAKEWAKKNMKRIKQIKPNKIGLERIKKSSPKINLDKIVPAEYGEDLITVFESSDTATSATGLSPSAATASATDNTTSNTNATSISELTGAYLPNTVDNSQLDCFPPIRDQGSMGSCCAFSTTYYQMTHMTGLAFGWNTKNNQDNTNKMSPKWTYNFANRGYDLGSSETDIYRILMENGCATWSEFPYNGDKNNPINYTQVSQNKGIWENAFKYRVKECGTVFVDNVSSNKDEDLETIKNMLVNGYVLSFASIGFDFYSGKVMDDPSTSADDSYVGQHEVISMKNGPYNHQMTIVGYNDDIWIDMNGNGTVDDEEKGAFRVADSYLTTYDNGFYWLSYDSVNSSKSSVPGFIDPPSGRRMSLYRNLAYWISVDTKNRPTLLAELTVNHKDRSQVMLEVGLGETSKTTEYISFKPCLYYIPGQCSYDGTSNAVDGVYVFDVSRLAEYAHDSSSRRWFFKVLDNTQDGSKAIIKSLNLVDAVNRNVVSSNNSSLPVTIDGSSATIYCDSTFNNLPGRPWTLLPPMPKSRQFGSAASANNKIYVAGGYTDSGIYKDLSVFNPATNSWTTETSLKTYKYGLRLVGLNNKVYSIGGALDDGTSLNNVEVYDTSSKVWSTSASLKESVTKVAAAACNGKIYTFGGQFTDWTYSNKIEVYDPASNTWSIKATMPEKLADCSAVELNGKIYVTGGYKEVTGPSEVVNCIYVYDPISNTFTKKADRTGTVAFDGAAQISGKIYFFPKYFYTDYKSTIEVYDPSKDEWSLGDQFAFPIESYCTASLNNNAYILGGYTSTYLNAVQRYSPCETLAYNDFTNYFGDNYPGKQKWSNIGVERLNGYTQNDYKLRFDGKDVLTLELNTNGYKDLILEYSSSFYATSTGTFNVEVNPNISDPTKWTSIATYNSLQNEWIKKFHNLSTDLESKPRIGIRFRFDKNTSDLVAAMLQYIKITGRNSGLPPVPTALETQFVNERFVNGNASKWTLNGCNASTGAIEMDNSDTATCTFSTKGYKNVTIQYTVNYSIYEPSNNRLNVYANSTPSDQSKFTVVDSIPYADFFGNTRKTDLGGTFDNLDSVQVRFALNQTTAADQGTIYHFIVTGEPIKTNVFSDLGVYDLTFNYDCTSNDYGWFLQSGLSTGSYLFGDKQITATSIPSPLVGAEFISPSYNSRLFTGSNLATVKTNAYADIFIAYDDRITTKPSWFTGWSDTGMDIKFDDGGTVTYSVFKKNFAAGSTINLGPNSTDPNTSWLYDHYIVLAKPVIISELSVKDTSNAVDWSLQSNPAVGNNLFGDRTLTITTLPSILTGAEWIRVANDSKTYTGSPLATFKVNSTADIFIAYDDRITTKPSWFTGWSDTGTDIKDSQNPSISYSVFKKTVIGGSTVTLGPNGHTSYCQYSVFAKPVSILSNLTVNDAANEMDWSIRTNPATGNLLFGDRTLTITTLPTILNGAEWIRPANDSKSYTGTPLATFKVDVNTDLYIAYDDRVTTKPSWFTGWSDTGTDVKDNQATPGTYSVFKKTFTAGTTITLGPSNAASFCQYVIFAKPQGL